MPVNKVYNDLAGIPVVVSYPASPKSGDPVLLGMLHGIALKDENASGITPVDFGPGVWQLEVAASAGAIAKGDPLFIAADASAISNDTTGYFFGFAFEAIDSGETETIDVAHSPSPGAGTLGTGTITATNIASGAVTATKIGSGAVSTAKIADDAVDGSKLDEGVVKVAIAAGTAAATDVTLAAITADDELVSVVAFDTGVPTDRTSEYAAGAGVLTKSAGTDESGNYLLIVYIDKTPA